MKICFIEDTLFHGGTQIWASEALKHFSDHKHDVTLICPEGSWISKQCKSFNVITYDFNKIVKQQKKYEKIFSTVMKDCDVAVSTVHPSREGFHMSIFFNKIIKENKLKTKFLPKCSTIVPEYLREFYFPDGDKDYVLAGTKTTKKQLIKLYNIPSKNIKVIYQGVDVERFNHNEIRLKEAKKKYSLPNKIIFGCLASYEKRKGQIFLIKAFKDVLKKRKDIHLILLGKGRNKITLEKFVKENKLEKKVSFFPFTKHPELVYEIIDVLVLPSLYREGLPNVLMEEMSMGKTIVSSKLGSIPEIINDKTGYLVEPGNVEDLANKMLASISNKKRSFLMGKFGRKLMKSKFDKKKQFEKYELFFKQISQ